MFDVEVAATVVATISAVRATALRSSFLFRHLIVAVAAAMMAKHDIAAQIAVVADDIDPGVVCVVVQAYSVIIPNPSAANVVHRAPVRVTL